LISVLMPAYNAERYVVEAVESILAQTYTDFEFLIVDDGSTDGTRAILEEYATRDARIRLISRENRGLVATLNEMIALARCELLARMDADDVALPGRFERQVAFLEAHPDVACVGGAQFNIDDRGYLLHECFALAEEHDKIQEMIFSGICPISHPCVMMRKTAVLAVGGYRPEMERAEDVDLWLRLGERSRLANIPDFVLKYRNHEQSATGRHQVLHLEYYKKACRDAIGRRGLDRQPPSLAPDRPIDRSTRFSNAVNFGWVGFMRGDRAMALHYAAKAFRLNPLRLEAWKLLAVVAIKPTRRRGASVPEARP
jgi:glycosyltransferase involved in cell wall biosynthesis